MNKISVLSELNENKKKLVVRQGFLWNMIASTLYAGMSALLLLAATRILGVKEAAVFSLAFSIAQLMFTIGYFEMRPYQVTDVKGDAQFKHYLTAKVVVCILMMAVSIGYIYIKKYDSYKSLVILLLCILKMLEAFEDVLHGRLQQVGRLDMAGKLQSGRLIVTMVGFILTLLMTKNMVISIIVMIIISVVFIGANVPIINTISKFELSFDWKKIRVILGSCFPVFLGAYLALYMGNAPKYAIDEFLAPEYQTYYNILFMPSFVVNLFSGFIFRPQLVPMANNWSEGNRKGYLNIVKKLLVWIVLLTVVIVGGAYILGIPVLSIVYGVNLKGFRNILVILILGGGMGAASTVLYYAVTVMRKQQKLLTGYAVTAAASFFIAPIFVEKWGLLGAATAYLLLISIRVGCFCVTLIRCLNETKQVKE